VKEVCVGESGIYTEHSFLLNPDENHWFVCLKCGLIANGDEHAERFKHWESGCCDPCEMRWRAEVADRANERKREEIRRGNS